MRRLAVCHVQFALNGKIGKMRERPKAPPLQAQAKSDFIITFKVPFVLVYRNIYKENDKLRLVILVFEYVCIVLCSMDKVRMAQVYNYLVRICIKRDGDEMRI